MFDDIPVQNGGRVPTNLPIEPEDIFASSPTDSGSTRNEPSVQPAGQSALSTGFLKPKPPEASIRAARMADIPRPEENAQNRVTQSNAQTSQMDMTAHAATGSSWVVPMIAIIGVVALVGSVGWYVYTAYQHDQLPAWVPFVSRGSTTTPNQATSPTEQDDMVVPPSEIGDDSVLFGQAVDADGDGLDDDRERQVGTDVANWDTDNDGLSDYSEVAVWKSDPVRPDTDNDTFIDGQEVKHGYNPTGPGKLFEPPMASSTAQ